MSEYVHGACVNECLGDIWVWVRVNVNCFFIILSALSCFYHTRWAQFPLSANKIASYLLRSLSPALFLLAVINVKHSVQFLVLRVNAVSVWEIHFFLSFKIRAYHSKHPETMTPMRPLAHLAPSAQLSKGLYEVRFVELPWFSCSFLFQRGKNLSVQVMSDDDMIPSNTTENRFYGSVSCFTAQDLFYIDTDNISQAIIILWPNALKLYIFIEPCCLIFQTEGPGFKLPLFYKTALNLPSQSGRSCTRVSFHVISWFIYMTDALMHAVESLGVHCSWTPPAVWVCYLNPWSRVPFLPFSWALTADPEWYRPSHSGQQYP